MARPRLRGQAVPDAEDAAGLVGAGVDHAERDDVGMVDELRGDHRVGPAAGHAAHRGEVVSARQHVVTERHVERYFTDRTEGIRPLKCRRSTAGPLGAASRESDVMLGGCGPGAGDGDGGQAVDVAEGPDFQGFRRRVAEALGVHEG